MICLKRFDFRGRKLGKFVAYQEELLIKGEYFDLIGFVVHIGSGCNFGHYIAFNRDDQGQWRCFDDETVSKVNRETVLKEMPYILFYKKREKKVVPVEEKKEPTIVIEESIPVVSKKVINSSEAAVYGREIVFHGNKLKKMTKLLKIPILLGKKRKDENVDSWGGNEKVHSQAMRTIRRKKQEEKDKYDRDFDVGKNKKVRAKKVFNKVNAFDKIAAKRN